MERALGLLSWKLKNRDGTTLEIIAANGFQCSLCIRIPTRDWKKRIAAWALPLGIRIQLVSVLFCHLIYPQSSPDDSSGWLGLRLTNLNQRSLVSASKLVNPGSVFRMSPARELSRGLPVPLRFTRFLRAKATVPGLPSDPLLDFEWELETPRCRSHRDFSLLTVAWHKGWLFGAAEESGSLLNVSVAAVAPSSHQSLGVTLGLILASTWAAALLRAPLGQKQCPQED